MKFTLERDTSIATITHVAKRAKAGTGFSGMLIEVFPSGCHLTAHDGDAACQGMITADIPEKSNGSFVVSAAEFLGIITRLPKGSHIDIALDGTQLRISSGRSSYKLPTSDAAAFQPMLTPISPTTLEVSSDVLRRLFEGPAIIAGSPSAPVSYAGVFFHCDVSGMVECAATDGHRLLRVSSDTKWPTGASPIIIPHKAVNDLLKVQADGLGCALSWSDKIASIKCGNWTFATKLIDGTFPDYQKFMPPASEKFVRTSAVGLSEAIKRLMTVADDKSQLRLSWSGTEMSANLRVNDSEGAEWVDCEIGGSDGSVAVDPSYLLEIIDALNTDSVTLHIDDKAKPFIVCGDDANKIAMIAPITGR